MVNALTLFSKCDVEKDDIFTFNVFFYTIERRERKRETSAISNVPSLIVVYSKFMGKIKELSLIIEKIPNESYKIWNS